MTTRQIAFMRALGAAVIGFVVANIIELSLIRAVAPTEMELGWISDLILAVAFGIAMYLWVHLREARSELSKLEREQIVLDAQLSMAADIQRKILPALPEALGGLGWAARLQGATKIGGDFYDFVQVSPDAALLIVGDIAGRGIPAALLMGSICTLFRMMARDSRDPAELLERLSAALYADHGGQPYATCIVCSYDLKERTVTYGNAGHPAGLILGSAGRQPLSVGGVPCGMFPESVYKSQTVPLREGEVGLILTDGITELVERDGEGFFDAVESWIVAIPQPVTASLVCDRVMRHAKDLVEAGDGKVEPDDRTVVAFVVGNRA